MRPVRLRILVVAASTSDARFCARVLEDHGDEVRISDDVMDALAHLNREAFDVVMISLSLPRGDGLALVHHVRALYPNIDVIVMSAPQEIEETAHAIALGVLQNVLLPLTGDAVLVAADRARERRLLVADRARLAREEAVSRRRTATYARCAAFVAETSAMAVASRVLDACAGEIPLRAGAIYVPGHGGAGLVRLAAAGETEALPRSVDDAQVAELDPTVVVQGSPEGVRVVMIGETELVALALLVPEANAVADEAFEGLEIVAALGTAAFAAARKVDAIARTGIKDPDTSAYTFAYFGDVAGREIDRAARHGRRFGLLTLGVDGIEEVRGGVSAQALVEIRRAITDAVLGSVRDSDVLARVEDDEYYLLLPETALLGAAAARRRIQANFRGAPELERVGMAHLDVVVGIAVYPADGADLGRLLRVGRRRGERARRGVFRRLHMAGRPFWECIDRLLGDRDASSVGPDGIVALPTELLAAHDEGGQSGHALMPRALVLRIVAQVATDAARHKASGTLYVAGDDQAASAVTSALSVADPGPLRAWVLGGASGRDPLRLPVRDPRLDEQILLLSMTELGGYLLVARPITEGLMLAYHSSDFDLVDGLMAALQGAYHLQPEVRG
jgi:diguanylate cyclase (GGDEF)-like protein